ncbi:MAG: hypothetical protein WA049_09625 [Ferribacterium limneticum]
MNSRSRVFYRALAVSAALHGAATLGAAFSPGIGDITLDQRQARRATAGAATSTAARTSTGFARTENQFRSRVR